MPTKELTFLFDVDNTLLNNDHVQEDLSNHIGDENGRNSLNRYSEKNAWVVWRASSGTTRIEYGASSIVRLWLTYI
jgi:FMN phosphatase YigB (HAD superfamily)